MQAAAEHPLIERELLAGVAHPRYQIVRLIGRGGMATVFLARDTALHRTVAIKMLHADLACDPALRDLMHAEARLGAQLSDPGVVPIYDFIEQDDVVAFVMPYAGLSLADLMQRSGPLPLAGVVSAMRTLGHTLMRLHRVGIVHRDIKPQNVLVDGERLNEVRLSDFGIASRMLADRGMSPPLRVSGTPDFMSPERQLRADDTDRGCDVYALGVLGYYLLSGALPYPRTLSMRERREAYRPLGTVRSDVPAEVQEAIERCISLRPRRRWADIESFLEALEPPAFSVRVRQLRARISAFFAAA
jgi:serine/threonine-protein kinase